MKQQSHSSLAKATAAMATAEAAKIFGDNNQHKWFDVSIGALKKGYMAYAQERSLLIRFSFAVQMNSRYGFDRHSTVGFIYAYILCPIVYGISVASLLQAVDCGNETPRKTKERKKRKKNKFIITNNNNSVRGSVYMKNFWSCAHFPSALSVPHQSNQQKPCAVQQDTHNARVSTDVKYTERKYRLNLLCDTKTLEFIRTNVKHV